MPGIAGIVSSRRAADCQATVAAMLGGLAVDDSAVSGQQSVPQMGLHVGWTAHQHSFAAVASGTSHGEVTVLVSGEYLTADGGATLVELYRKYGDQCVTHLNGLFSGVLIDHRRDRALLFNDRYGIERLYVHESGGDLYFASQVKPLLRVLPQVRGLDEQAMAQFVAFGCTFGRQTLFRGVELLPGGTVLSIGNRQVRKARYFRPAFWEAQPEISESEFQAALEGSFTRILPRYVGTGEGVGISLTGGLDTRMIVACLPPVSRPPVCYTFSGQATRTLDETIAARVAASCGLEHRVLRIGRDFFADYGAHVDRTVAATDGLLGATGAHELYLNGRAAELAPVRLTGNFGSEVLRGMSTFKPLDLWTGFLSPEFSEAVKTAARAGPDRTCHPVTFAAFQEIPFKLFPTLAAGRARVTFRTPYLDNELVSLAYRMPPQVRASPAAALRLVARNKPQLARVPTDRGLSASDSLPMRLARRTLAEVGFKIDYLHQEGLPGRFARAEPLLDLVHGTGLFGCHKYLPYRLWFRTELADHVRSVLTDPRTARLPFCNARALNAMASDHIAGRRNLVREIGMVLTCEAIHRVLLMEQPQTV